MHMVRWTRWHQVRENHEDCNPRLTSSSSSSRVRDRIPDAQIPARIMTALKNTQLPSTKYEVDLFLLRNIDGWSCCLHLVDGRVVER